MASSKRGKREVMPRSLWKWLFRTATLSTIASPWFTLFPPFRR